MSDTTQRYNKTDDLVGSTFGHFKVLSFSGYRIEDNRSPKLRAHWHCRCTRCGLEHDLSIRNLKGKKLIGHKEKPHKLFLCDCDRERKLYKKLLKKWKLPLSIDAFIVKLHEPCKVCGSVDTFDLEESEVQVYYNYVNKDLQSICDAHV